MKDGIKFDINLPDVKTIKKVVVRSLSVIGLVVGLTIGMSFYFKHYRWDYQFPVLVSFRSPVIVTGLKVEEPVLVEVEVVEAVVVEEYKYITGEASFYSWAGCIGCNKDRIMANGEQLSDSEYTVALIPEDYKRFKNQNVLIINTDSNQTVIAKVTDTGGFAKYGRVADLSLATKDALGCGDLCSVSIRAVED